ncbi:DNA-methyltransferase [Leptospira meyeri]|uniref:DNA-methyltransferase n=1 Tax=Leptospira meyeri TaxID=29508 RepID=UPI00223DB78D|nr:site-specific DNA-methyltransferase [Leptospira meyeri]MCW7490935.1 site-specific DNA-methyltransferase [Leptospira meyeri]
MEGSSRKEWVDKMNDSINLINGNALDLFKNINDESIDLIISDPPYNLGKNYGNNFDNISHDEYLEFTRKWLTEAKRVLKKNGSIYVFMGVRFISYLYQIMEREIGLEFNSWITWHYTQGMGKTKGYSPRHDDILFFTKSTDFIFNLDEVRVPQKYYRQRNNMRGANPGDVWQFSHVHYSNPNRQDHPTQKPEGLIERMILASSLSGLTVLDPFSGSGTTARVCQQLDRKFIGFEINPEYIEQTKNRLNQPFTGFDSIDPRLERIPNDLRDVKLREDYIENHKKWFLNNHENALKEFEKSVQEKYGTINKKSIADDSLLFSFEQTQTPQHSV